MFFLCSFAMNFEQTSHSNNNSSPISQKAMETSSPSPKQGFTRHAALLLLVACAALTMQSCSRSEEARNTSQGAPHQASSQEVQSAGMGIENAADDKSTAAPPPTAKVFALQKVDAPQNGKRADFAWLDGKKTVKLSEASKGKPVFINFWATWCPPCRRELPDIVELQKEYGAKVVFIGVAFENEATAAQAAPLVSSFAEKNNLGYVNIVGDEKLVGKISAAYGNVEALPTTFIIDKNGVVLDKLIGGRSKEDFLSALKKVL